MEKDLFESLLAHLCPSKKEKFEAVIQQRTRRITFVLEDFFQEHNISAVMRSADIFGIQDIHIIEKKNQYKVSTGIDRGASRWLDTHRYTTTKDCINALREKQYKIVATVAHAGAHTLETLPINEKLAFFMGTEYAGLSNDVLEYADYQITLPMVGFTQSFNVSVCAALCMYATMQRLHGSEIEWCLSEIEKKELFDRWVFQSARHIDVYRKN